MDLATSTTTSPSTIESTTANDTADATPDTAVHHEPLKLAVILGSNREGRFGPVVSDWFLARAAESPDFTVELVDVAALDLPTSLSYDPDPSVLAELGKISPRLAEADAFVVLTPEYNHSYPAALKSLIDWHHAEWAAKPVGFVSYGGMAGGLRAVEHLRQVFGELHSVAVRDTVSFHNAAAHFDERGRHRDPAGSDAAARSMLGQLAWWGLALREAKAVRPYGG
jgi:NAD(P)H-dependent FMN reductase